MCSAPARQVQATQVSTVPKASSPRSARDRSGSAWSRMAATLVAEALGATRMPRPWSSRQVPTVRRSCQPSPGATGTPVARSHTMVEARWLATPTASTGPPVGQARRGHLDHGRGHGRGIELDQPGEGGVGEHRHVVDVLYLPSGRTTAPRTPEVPTSTTRMLMARAPGRRGR